MSGPCFTHFQMNCQICFPTAADGNNKKTSPQTAPASTSLTATPVTVSVSPGGGGDADSSPNSTVGISVTPAKSSTQDVPAMPTGASNSEKQKKRKPLPVEYRLPKKKKSDIIDCAIAQQMLRRDLGLPDQFFISGDVLAWALEPDDPAFRYIHDYVANGQAHGYGLKVCSILRIIAKAKSLEDAQTDFKEDPDTKDKLRMMLWHGTRNKSVASILEKGLILPRYRYQMFGGGIYFADRVSKSCQYCWTHSRQKMFVFLCDVLVGKMYESKHAIPGLTSPPVSHIGTGSAQRTIQNDSVKGVGRNIPDEQGNKVLDGSVWQLGKTVQQPNDNGGWRCLWGNGYVLNFNEYVVFNEKQVQPKYLVKLEYMDKPFYEKLE